MAELSEIDQLKLELKRKEVELEITDKRIIIEEGLKQEMKKFLLELEKQ